MGARVAALIAAVAMVVGALAVRGALDDRQERRETVLRLVCATQLGSLCERVAAAIGDEAVVRTILEDPAVTADRLSNLAPGADRGLDGWITVGPWPEIVAGARTRAGRTVDLEPADAALGHSPLVFAVWRDRAEAMSQSCGGAVTWRCVGEVAGKQRWTAAGGREEWGPIKLGFDDPAGTGTGLAFLGAAVHRFAGTPDISSNELDADDGFRGFVDGLAAGWRQGVAVERMLAQGPAVLDGFAGPAVFVRAAAAGSARAGQVSIMTPEPAAAVGIHVGAAPGRVSELLRSATGPLTEAGWEAGPPPGAQLTPGVLDYLRSVWQEVSR